MTAACIKSAVEFIAGRPISLIHTGSAAQLQEVLIYVTTVFLLPASIFNTKLPAMREVEESIVIAAPPSRVWSCLADLGSWPSWNTFVTSIKVQPPHSGLAVGSKQLITISPSPSNNAASESYTNVISTLTPERELRWNGVIGHAFIFDTEHWCKLEPVPNEDGLPEHTRFTQGERISGLLAPVVEAMGKLEELRSGYARMNGDLKRAVEGMSA